MPNWHRLRSRVALRTRRLSQRGASLRRAPARTRTVDSRMATSPSPTGTRARDAPMTAGPKGPGGATPRRAFSRVTPRDSQMACRGAHWRAPRLGRSKPGGGNDVVADWQEAPSAPTTAGAPRSWPDVVGRPAGPGGAAPGSVSRVTPRDTPIGIHRPPSAIVNRLVVAQTGPPGAGTAGSRAGKARRSDHQAGPRRRFSALRPPLRAPPGRARPRRSGAGRGPRRPGR
jgi:hypothetical protein